MCAYPVRLLKRGSEILQREGLYSLVKKGFSYVRRSIFARGTFLVFEHDLIDIPPIGPKGDAALVAMCSPDDLERYVTESHDFSRLDLRHVKRLLLRQAWLFCLLKDEKVAHQSWVGFNRNAVIDPIAPHLEYHQMAYIGDCFTWPDYRGEGLYPYVLIEICRALKARGLARAYLTVSPDNSASIRGVTKAGFRQCGKGRLIQGLWGSSWRVLK